MENSSPRKKLKSPTTDINSKTSITCSNVPEGLFDVAAAKQHFSKFGRLQKIRLFPKRHMCIIEYEQPLSVAKAVLNAGAFDGFMFDVVRSKPKLRKRSKVEDDPDWVPDQDVEKELSVMGSTPVYRTPRQKPMEIEMAAGKSVSPRVFKSPQARKNPVNPIRQKPLVIMPSNEMDTPITIASQASTMSTAEAAAQLHQLRLKVSNTPDEQYRILDQRDRILRAWGGTGARAVIGGPTIGTCPDMCPEKERVQRQNEHQVMTLESIPGSDGDLDPNRALKQYSRSSADQEMPMCYELRNASCLARTCSYLLHEIAQCTRQQVSLADWFHFMWDRFRGIRKDITQQALCCAESIKLVEIAARFHAHCSARLADLEHTQFDQKLNTDNLTKCLQTLKHMYADVESEMKPNEAEFRGYIALLNLGDANFWWEIKQLPEVIQKSAPITFAMLIFNALDNNNYVRFFRLIKEKATYLQACILLRYFNDVRARGLARIVKAFSPRGGSRYPAQDLINALAFESIESMQSFINHYGLRFAKSDEDELTVILDRNQFIEDSDPYPISRSIDIIESKKQGSVGEVLAGGNLPPKSYEQHQLSTSFNRDGTLKDSALLAEDQGYSTVNNTNKNVQSLKMELSRFKQGNKFQDLSEKILEPKSKLFAKTENPSSSVNTFSFVAPKKESFGNTQFSFKPAIPVASVEVLKSSPEKISDSKNSFSFSKPQHSVNSNLLSNKNSQNLFATQNNTFEALAPIKKHTFGSSSNENIDPQKNSQSIFKDVKVESSLFQKTDASKSIFGRVGTDTKNPVINNVFNAAPNKNIFSKPSDDKTIFKNQNNVFGSKNVFSVNKDTSKSDNIFEKPKETNTATAANVFGAFSKPSSNLFSTANVESEKKPVLMTNGEVTSKSPSTLFKSALNPPNGTDAKSYSIFQTKNKTNTVANNIFTSVNTPIENDAYNFNQSEELEAELVAKRVQEQKILEEIKHQEMLKKEEEQAFKQREEERQRQELLKRQNEIKRLEEIRKKEEIKKQEELKKKLEDEKRAEARKKAEEDRKFKEMVDKESSVLVDELIMEVNDETLKITIKKELEILNKLLSYAGIVTEEIFNEICLELCTSEIKAEKYWSDKLLKKWYNIWKKNYVRNLKRRTVLENTPIWLPDNSPVDEACRLRRLTENETLRHMNAIHRGYKFTGEMKLLPSPEPYKVMEIIRSALLKRLKQINYPYDKCCFWKVALVSPGLKEYLYRKIDVQKWLLQVFGDNKEHEESNTLICVQKQSWNHLVDFAISVSLANRNGVCKYSEALEGANGLIFYATEKERNELHNVEEVLKHTYKYQLVPVVVIVPKENERLIQSIESLLAKLLKENAISAYKMFILDCKNELESLNLCTKSALKWIAKKYPRPPPLEIDRLKSLCERYLGTELWARLRSQRDSRMNTIFKDLPKLLKCYNLAVDKLTEVITNEHLFNYPPFPLEFARYINKISPYPKPYEFITNNVRNSENISVIKSLLVKLKLEHPIEEINPCSMKSMQTQMQGYCKQIGWFENPSEVICKVVAVLPSELTDVSLPTEDFIQYYKNYDFIDFLNVLVYEKISCLDNFDNRFAMYESSALKDYQNIEWLFESDILRSIKHKALNYGDDIDLLVESKRRKFAEPFEYLMLDANDCTMVEDNIKATNESIIKYSNCENAVKQLEDKLNEEKMKSMKLENMLKAALSNV